MAVFAANIFALQSTDLRGLYSHPDPLGPDNDAAIAELAGLASLVVCGWGNQGVLNERSQQVTRLLRSIGATPRCLRMIGAGQPVIRSISATGSSRCRCPSSENRDVSLYRSVHCQRRTLNCARRHFSSGHCAPELLSIRHNGALVIAGTVVSIAGFGLIAVIAGSKIFA